MGVPFQRSRRVAVYMASFALGDARMIGAMLNRLKARGFSPLVLVDDDSGVHRAELNGIEIVGLGTTEGLLRSDSHAVRSFANSLRIRKILRQRKIGWLFISHTAAGAAMGVATALTVRPRVRTIVFLTGAPRHGNRIAGWGRMVYKALGRMLSRADALFSDAHYISAAWAPWLGRRKASFLGRVPLALRAPARDERREAGKVVAFTIARMGAQKRLDLCMRATKLVRAEGVPLFLHVIGVDADDPAFEQLAAEEGVQDAVCALGYVDKVSFELAGADIYLQTSDFEPLGMGLLEALGQGLRVVSTDCDGPSEILRGGLGWLAPRGDAAGLARAIQDALAAPPFDAARQIRAQDYGIGNGMPELLDLLEGQRSKPAAMSVSA